MKQSTPNPVFISIPAARYRVQLSISKKPQPDFNHQAEEYELFNTIIHYFHDICLSLYMQLIYQIRVLFHLDFYVYSQLKYARLYQLLATFYPITYLISSPDNFLGCRWYILNPALATRLFSFRIPVIASAAKRNPA